MGKESVDCVFFLIAFYFCAYAEQAQQFGKYSAMLTQEKALLKPLLDQCVQHQ